MTLVIDPLDESIILHDHIVYRIFDECSLTGKEDSSYNDSARGIWHSATFHPIRLLKYRDFIARLLDQVNRPHYDIPITKLCERDGGSQWTDEPLMAEQLLLLGVAIGKARITYDAGTRSHLIRINPVLSPRPVNIFPSSDQYDDDDGD